MLVTNGSLTVEDRVLRRIASQKLRASLSSFATKSESIVAALVSEVDARTSVNLTAERLMNSLLQNPNLQREAAFINAYTDAFPEFSSLARMTHKRIISRARRRFERALQPHEHARRFRFTLGLS